MLSIKDRIREHIQLVTDSASLLEQISRQAGMAIVEAFQAGGRLYLFGSGGSACAAQYVVTSLMHRYRLERPSLPAIALTTDTGVLTSIADDTDYRDVFARQLRAVAEPRDVVWAWSAAGASTTVLDGMRTAREIGCTVVASLGRDDVEARDLSEVPLTIASDDVARVQELHHLFAHLVCEYVEYALFIEPSTR